MGNNIGNYQRSANDLAAEAMFNQIDCSYFSPSNSSILIRQLNIEPAQISDETKISKKKNSDIGYKDQSYMLTMKSLLVGLSMSEFKVTSLEV